MLRTVLSALLWLVAVLLTALAAAALVAAFADNRAGGSGSGAAFALAAALIAGSGARAVTRGSRGGAAGSAPEGATVIAPAAGPRAAILLGATLTRGAQLPAPDPAVRYRERASQFPLLGAPIAGLLVGGSVAGLTQAGGPNGQGNGAALSFLVLIAFVGAIYLVLVVADLANGIEIAEGRFTLGARGVPAAGRIWRRVEGSLTAVRGWDVLTAEQVRVLDAGRRAEARSGRRRIYLGDLRLFNRRQVLELTVDPGALTARLPSRIQVGYVFVSARQAGAVWDGTLLIGTRRPAALTAALEHALPGRRAKR